MLFVGWVVDAVPLSALAELCRLHDAQCLRAVEFDAQLRTTSSCAAPMYQQVAEEITDTTQCCKGRRPKADGDWKSSRITLNLFGEVRLESSCDNPEEDLLGQLSNRCWPKSEGRPTV